MQKVSAIILAAGAGTRMKSNLPKILHPVCGKPMIYYVLDAIRDLNLEKKILIVGNQQNLVQEKLKDIYNLIFVSQDKQLGTGHAVNQARNKFKNYKGSILVLCGDTPLLKKETLQNLIDQHIRSKNDLTMLTCIMENPSGYGRIIRNTKNEIIKIVEDKDAADDEKKIKEINTGIYCFRSDKLFDALLKIRPDNKQKELYLTDAIEIFMKQKFKISAIPESNSIEIMGINNRIELAKASNYIRNSILEYWMENGVTIIHPESTFIDENVKIEKDVVIYPFTIIEGNSIIKSCCKLGPFSVIKNTLLSENTEVINSVITDGKVQNNVRIGPYANIRPHTVLEEKVKVGNFCEIKKSHIGKNSKISHLSYIGDSEVGQDVNIGAGTITCNFDGENKFKTIIEDNAFIGSNTNLVAPVQIGKRALIAAGSTITKAVPDESLGIARAKQINIDKYYRHRKK